MSEQTIQFIFCANGFNFGPFRSFREAADAAACYVERCYQLETKANRPSALPLRWPRVVIEEVRDILA